MTFSTYGGVQKAFIPSWIVKGSEEYIRSILDFLVFSSLYLALECVAMTYISCYIQQVRFYASTLIIPFLVTFAIYNINRKTDENEDAINQEKRFLFTKRYEHSLFGLSLVSIAIALGLAAYRGLPVLLVTLTPFLFGLLYSIRWLPPGIPYQRLKEIPLAKNLIVCASWALPASLLPVFLAGGTIGIKTTITCLLFCSWGFLASISPDIRDRIGDASAGVRTIPVIFGEERTKKLLKGMNLSFGCLILPISFLYLPFSISVILVATVAYAQTCIYLLDSPAMKNLVCDLLADGQYIFFAGAILALSRIPGVL